MTIVTRNLSCLSVVLALISGCTPSETPEEETSSLNEGTSHKETELRLSALEDRTGINSAPVEFVVSSLEYDYESGFTEIKLSGAISSSDERVKASQIYVDGKLILKLGKRAVYDEPIFFYLKNGVGNFDTNIYLDPGSSIRNIDPDMELTFEFEVNGWAHMNPGVIVVDD